MANRSNKNLPFAYNIHTKFDREAMLKTLGMRSVGELFSNLPKKSLLNKHLDLPTPMPEWQLDNQLRALASKNQTTLTIDSYLGGGAYQHYIPAVCDTITSRGEFLTAYTPYQPEMS